MANFSKIRIQDPDPEQGYVWQNVFKIPTGIFFFFLIKNRHVFLKVPSHLLDCPESGMDG
jgi:hypothetical protein